MKTMIYLAISFAIFLSGCDWIAPDDPEFDYNQKSAKVIHTNNDFGLDLFKLINTEKSYKNLMISPTSISLALGMAYNGAENATKVAFDSVLNYDGLSREEVNTITLDLINTLITNSKGNLLDIANAIWYRENLNVYESFIELNKTYFDAEVKALDFSDPTAVDEINSWVADQTHDKIEDIIQKLAPEDMMVLINALYFNCLWEYEFDPDDTNKEPFYKEDGTQYGNVDMMSLEGTFKFASSDDFTAVELPYKNEKFSMHLFLPADDLGVNGLITRLDAETWEEWNDLYVEKEDVKVSLPKFKFEYERTIGPDLIQMGLAEAFSTAADFSGISTESLMISKVIHKTFIDVNEEGTEAAAATAVVMELTSMPNNTVIRLDRPFLFAITENSSNAVIFIGKVIAPEYE